MCVCFWMLHTRAEPATGTTTPKKKKKKILYFFIFYFFFIYKEIKRKKVFTILSISFYGKKNHKTNKNK